MYYIKFSMVVLIILAAIVFALFVALFLQSAYLRSRVLASEKSLLSSDTAAIAACPDLDNGVRAYALRVACCKMNDLNLSSVLPVLPDDARHPRSRACKGPGDRSAWLVLRKTSTSKQLVDDVDAGRVKYLVALGGVVRVAPANLERHVSDAQATALRHAYTVLAVGDPFPDACTGRRGHSEVVLPWAANGSSSSLDKLLAAVAARRRCSAPEEASDLLLHVWAYGVSAHVAS